jgi:hypothetical protein
MDVLERTTEWLAGFSNCKAIELADISKETRLVVEWPTRSAAVTASTCMPGLHPVRSIL